MARVLICEPHPDVRSLLAFVVGRGGHEPVVSDGSESQAARVDAIVLEPGDPSAHAVAVWARAHAPQVALVCASIFPPGPGTASFAPDVYLVKPFPLAELDRALTAALQRRSAGGAVRSGRSAGPPFRVAPRR